MNPEEEKQLHEFLERFRKDVLPEMEKAAMSITIYSGKVDAKLCLELGAAVLLDKPIILVVLPGSEIPPKLRRIARRIIYGDPTENPQIQKEVEEAINRVIQSLN